MTIYNKIYFLSLPTLIYIVFILILVNLPSAVKVWLLQGRFVVAFYLFVLLYISRTLPGF